MKPLHLTCLVLLASALSLRAESGPVPPPAGSPASAWHDYQNAVAAWNQREAAARQQAAQSAASAAWQAQVRAREEAAASAQRQFEARQRERVAQQEAFRLQQERQAVRRYLEAQTALMQQKLQRQARQP